MTTIRFIYKNLWRNGTILTQSSEHAQFPSENTQDDIITLAWTSRYGTSSGNGLFTVSASNKYIDFDEGGAELTATLTTGAYTGQTLATEIKTQLDAAGALTYTVTYTESTGKFTIAAGGNFTLRWLNGTHAATDANGLLGFSALADDTGAATYTSDTVVCHSSEYIDVDFGSAQEFDTVALLGHNLTSAATITIYGADDSAFTSNVVSDSITYAANNIVQFLAAARTKRYCRIYVADIANPSCYVKIGTVVVGKYFAPNRGFGQYSEGEVDESETEKSPANNLFSIQERTALVNWSLPFKGLDTSSVSSIRAMMAEVGVVKAVLFNTDSASPNTYSYWAHFTELSPVEVLRSGVYHSWTATLEQVI